jgi:hypothetical protein
MLLLFSVFFLGYFFVLLGWFFLWCTIPALGCGKDWFLVLGCFSGCLGFFFGLFARFVGRLWGIMCAWQDLLVGRFLGLHVWSRAFIS